MCGSCIVYKLAMRENEQNEMYNNSINYHLKHHNIKTLKEIEVHDTNKLVYRESSR